MKRGKNFLVNYVELKTNKLFKSDAQLVEFLLYVEFSV